MKRAGRNYITLDMVRIIMLGAGVVVTVLAGFSIGLQSLRGGVNFRDNPGVDALIIGVFILALVTAINLVLKRRSNGSSSKK